MREVSQMGFREILALPIPCEVVDGAIRRTATYRLHSPSGGAGMGEYPATVTLVLSDGKVYQWDGWSDEPTIVSYHGREQQEISF